MKKNEIKDNVSKKYREIAENSNSCCSSASSDEVSESIGYSREEIESAPEDANLGLGCGNPQAIAEIKSGETVVDLGSGAGFDVFIAANKVGCCGKVIGVDMTPEMISRARETAEKENYSNVEFRLGEIEYLPVADNQADILISNCVINLSTDKQQVYNEMYRVLKKGGRIALSDTVMINNIPKDVEEDPNMHSC